MLYLHGLWFSLRLWLLLLFLHYLMSYHSDVWSHTQVSLLLPPIYRFLPITVSLVDSHLLALVLNLLLILILLYFSKLLWNFTVHFLFPLIFVRSFLYVFPFFLYFFLGLFLGGVPTFMYHFFYLSIHHAPYLRNHLSFNHNFWYV